MKTQPRPILPADHARRLFAVERARRALATAYKDLRYAPAPATARKVHSAIKSCDGAIRNARRFLRHAHGYGYDLTPTTAEKQKAARRFHPGTPRHVRRQVSGS